MTAGLGYKQQRSPAGPPDVYESFDRSLPLIDHCDSSERRLHRVPVRFVGAMGRGVDRPTKRWSYGCEVVLGCGEGGLVGTVADVAGGRRVGVGRRGGVGFVRAGWSRVVVSVGVVAFAVVVAGLLIGRPVGVPGVRPGAPDVGGLWRLPVAARGPVSGVLGADDRRFWVRQESSGLAAVNGPQRFAVSFSRSGAGVLTGSQRLSLSFAGVGYGGRVHGSAAVVPVASRNRVSFVYGALSEWFVNGPLGLEQGFRLRSRPGGTGPGALTLALNVAGSWRVRVDPGRKSAEFLAPDRRVALRYTALSALDARGRLLPARLSVNAGRLLIAVDDRGAAYPLRVDPLVQQGAKLVGTGAIGNALQGESVAISRDGNTALIGGPHDDNGAGAAWVFTRTGSTWTQQGPKLVGTGAAASAYGAGQGASVALSSDGNTALIGGPGDADYTGAAWVFTRTGTTWTQQGSKLVGTGAALSGSQQGSSVTLSGDGNTALIGAPADNFDEVAKGDSGAVWVFTRSGTTWTQQGPKLATGAPDAFGASLALSNDGNTALIGGPAAGDSTGAAWVFTRTGTTWTEQAALAGTGAPIATYETGGASQGWSVALSSDGNTALIGGPAVNYNGVTTGYAGAAWVFTRSGTTWTQQGPKLVGTPAISGALQGWSVALSSDGNTALIGGNNKAQAPTAGVMWVFTRSGTTWTQQESKLAGTAASTGTNQGPSVALSGDGHTALFGLGDNVGIGAAWVFAFKRPTKPPGTKILHARTSQKHHQVTISFEAIGAATRFQCALVKKPRQHHSNRKPRLNGCESPKTYTHLKPGGYTFEVRAINTVGADPTPATKRFTMH